MSIRHGIVAAVFCTLGACATRPGMSGQHTAQVPAGTPFVATLEETIGSTISAPGERFSMHLDTPLRAVDGTVVVPLHAVLIGRITEARAGAHPTVRYDDLALVTSMGTIPLQASVRNPDATATGDGHELSMMPPTPPRVLPAPNGTPSVPSPVASSVAPPVNAATVPALGVSPAAVPAPNVATEYAPSAYGGGPQVVRQPDGAVIVLPVGTRLNMVLDAPLVGVVPPVAR